MLKLIHSHMCFGAGEKDGLTEWKVFETEVCNCDIYLLYKTFKLLPTVTN